MSSASRSGDFGQVITAMVTPFDADGRIDDAGVARLVDHLFDHGSDGIVVCGTTGEAPVLSADEKARMYSLVLAAARGRGPVIAGTGSNETTGSVALTRRAAAAGVDGILLITPYYNKPSQEGLYRHFRTVAECVELPVMLYNVPPRTGVNMEAATVIRLANDVPNIVAVKEASGNLMQATDIIDQAPDGFTLYSGEDGLVLPLLAVGGTGVVSVTAHLVGADMKAMHRAFFAGDAAEAARLHRKMQPIVRACFQPTTPSPAPLKAALNAIGVHVGGLRPPLVEANASETAIITAALGAYGPLA